MGLSVDSRAEVEPDRKLPTVRDLPACRPGACAASKPSKECFFHFLSDWGKSFDMLKLCEISVS